MREGGGEGGREGEKGRRRGGRGEVEGGIREEDVTLASRGLLIFKPTMYQVVAICIYPAHLFAVSIFLAAQYEVGEDEDGRSRLPIQSLVSLTCRQGGRKGGKEGERKGGGREGGGREGGREEEER